MTGRNLLTHKRGGGEGGADNKWNVPTEAKGYNDMGKKSELQSPFGPYNNYQPSHKVGVLPKESQFFTSLYRVATGSNWAGVLTFTSLASSNS